MSANRRPSTGAGLLQGLANRVRGEFASRLARDSLLLFSFSILGRAIGLGREVLIATLFGVSGQLDAYVLALLVPSFLVNMLGASFSASLIPSIGRILATEGEQAAKQGIASALALLCTLLALAALLLYALPLQALRALSPLAEAEGLAHIRSLQMALLPIAVLGSANNVLAALVNLRGNFKGPALSTLGNNLALLLFTAALFPSLGIYSLVVAMDAGFLLETCSLLVLTRKAWGNVFCGWRGLARTRAAVPGLLGNWGMLALGAGLFGLTAFVDNAIASTLGTGSVSALSYAWKVPAGLATLLGLPLSTVLLPYFTGIAHNAPPSQLLRTCRGIIKRLLLLAVPLALAGALAAPLLVDVLFQRGKFDAQAAQLVSLLLSCYFIQLPCYLLWIATSRMLQALSQFRFLLLLQVSLLVVNALTSLALTPFLGVVGITLSSTLMYMLSAGATVAAISRHIKRRA